MCETLTSISSTMYTKKILFSHKSIKIHARLIAKERGFLHLPHPSVIQSPNSIQPTICLLNHSFPPTPPSRLAKAMPPYSQPWPHQPSLSLFLPPALSLHFIPWKFNLVLFLFKDQYYLIFFHAFQTTSGLLIQ